MITKSQALNLKYRDEILQISHYHESINKGRLCIQKNITVPLDKPIKWRVNGAIKTWKTRPNEFKIPIKHGLYDYGYLTHENAHLFTLELE